MSVVSSPHINGLLPPPYMAEHDLTPLLDTSLTSSDCFFPPPPPFAEAI